MAQPPRSSVPRAGSAGAERGAPAAPSRTARPGKTREPAGPPASARRSPQTSPPPSARGADRDAGPPEAPANAPDRARADGTRRERRRTREAREPFGWTRPGAVNVKMVYTAYLASLAVPIAALFGAYFAREARRKSPPAWLMTHYVYQMRTFWIGLGANLLAWALMFAGVGLLLFPMIAMWVVARAVHGLIRVAQSQPIDDPNTLLI